MSEITQLVITLVLFFLFDRFIKPYLLRKWLGVVLVAAGAVGCVAASQIRLLGFDLGVAVDLCRGAGGGVVPEAAAVRADWLKGCRDLSRPGIRFAGTKKRAPGVMPIS